MYLRALLPTTLHCQTKCPERLLHERNHSLHLLYSETNIYSQKNCDKFYIYEKNISNILLEKKNVKSIAKSKAMCP